MEELYIYIYTFIFRKKKHQPIRMLSLTYFFGTFEKERSTATIATFQNHFVLFGKLRVLVLNVFEIRKYKQTSFLYVFKFDFQKQ
jgi:23S rRNA maturation-related 3'-5' exoribonuclease YhaM